jgi:secreted trypsin-like serine protease
MTPSETSSEKNYFLTTNFLAIRFCSEVLPEDAVIVAGTTNLKIGGTVYNILERTIHPTFNITNYIDDISVIKIDGEFDISESMQIAEIGEVADNDTCTVLGWGATVNTWGSAILMFANLRALSVEECDKLAEDGSNDLQRGPGQVCGFGDGINAICIGDTGDSLISNGQFVGIASYSVTLCGWKTPDIYTRVAYYKDWINTII